jgi:hypothetical protein
MLFAENNKLKQGTCEVLDTSAESLMQVAHSISRNHGKNVMITKQTLWKGILTL